MSDAYEYLDICRPDVKKLDKSRLVQVARLLAFRAIVSYELTLCCRRYGNVRAVAVTVITVGLRRPRSTPL